MRLRQATHGCQASTVEAPAERSVSGDPDCTAIIVTYNSAADIVGLLESLPGAADRLRFHVIVVDNASSDETLELVASVSDAQCVLTGANLGFASAVNVGLRLVATTSHVLILNPDVRLEPRSIRNLCEMLEDPSVGIVVPMLLDEAGDIYPSLRREPSLLGSLGEALFGNHFPRRPPCLIEMVRRKEDYHRPHDVDWATGAVMLVSRNCAAAVGNWDERFFLYSEETDYAARVRAAGYRVVYAPEARGVHRGGGSGRSHQLEQLMAVNRIRYYEKRHGALASGLFRCVVTLNEMLRAWSRGNRMTLRVVARRSSWQALPGGRPGWKEQ
jgi:N-acetylglucosaminyl-diphospho-decaprenol L-rhamnosyltransferase